MSSSDTPSAARRHTAWIALLLLALALLAGRALLPPTDPGQSHDLALIFEQALRIDNTVRPPETEPNTPVLVSGKVTFRNLAADHIQMSQGRFLGLRRIVEVYAWVEEAVPEAELPPNPTRTDRYRYRLEWLTNPTPWRDFQVWKGHTYTAPAITSETFFAVGTAIGRLLIDLDEATLIGWKPLTLDPKVYPFLEARIHDTHHFYERPEARDAPEPGDYRIRYEVVELPPEGNPYLTVLGSRDFNRIVPFVMADGRPLMLVLTGSEQDLREALGPPALPLALLRLLANGLPLGAGLLALAALILAWRGRRRGTA